MNRYFKREKYIGNTGIETEVDFWKWIKGKGLFVKYKYDDKFYKSEYYLKELLSGIPEGVITEIVPPINLLNNNT